MISNLRISVAELVVWALLAAAGLTWISLRALDGAAWLMDWLRDRVTPLLEDDDEARWAYPDDGLDDELPPPLPPERTWEQMTSHQLPIAARHARSAENPCDDCLPWPTHELQVVGYGNLNARQERRPPEWESEHRAHYVAMGFDYPSGLMARVRELAP